MPFVNSEYETKRMEIRTLTDPLTGSNCYIVEENGQVLLIDPNLPEEVIQILKRESLTLSMVILTHEHCDHISGLNRIRAWNRTQTQVIASRRCSENIQSAKMNLSRIFGVYLFYVTGERCRDYPAYTCEGATRIFDEELEMDWNHHEIHCYHIPGHSEGSIAVTIDQKIIFSGDSYLRDQEVITKFPGGSQEDYEQKAKTFFEALPDDCRICPGHGGIFWKGESVIARKAFAVIPVKEISGNASGKTEYHKPSGNVS